MRAPEPILDHLDGVVLCLEPETLTPLYASAATRGRAELAPFRAVVFTKGII